MRKLPLSVSISAAVHVALVALVAASDLGARDAAPAAPTLTPIEIVPIDVSVLADPPQPERPASTVARVEPTARAEPRAAAEPRHPRTPVAPRDARQPRDEAVPAAATSAAVATGTAESTRGGTGTGEPRDTAGPAGTGRSGYFDMRRGSRVDLSLPASRDALDNVPRGSTPVAAAGTSGLLEDAAGGRKKSDQDVFVARVERDGSVKLVDAANLQAELSANPAKLLSGRFDLTDYLMRRTGADPYASRKLKFLDDTRDERVAIGKRWRQQQLQQTTQIIRKNLARAWASSPDLAARKQALFALWDEIVEPTSRDDLADEVLVEASRTARAAVIGFIRARLPAGSELAYTEAELVALNANKQSHQRFAPYDS